MTDLMIFNCTHGKEDPERAILPFVAANAAVAAGHRAAVFCTVDAVWLGTVGGTDSVAIDGLPPLSELHEHFVSGGGEVWLCITCTSRRGITEDALAEGASLVSAARIVEEIANGAKTMANA